MYFNNSLYYLMKNFYIVRYSNGTYRSFYGREVYISYKKFRLEFFIQVFLLVNHYLQ